LPSDTAQLRFLIAGLGSAGRRHLANLRVLGQREIAVYRVRGLSSSDVDGARAYSDLGEALASFPDVVLVTNPTSLHLPIALAAAERGCHVFVEKPLSHQWEGVEELLHLVAQRQVIGAVGYQYRFHPSLRRLEELLDQGSIGRPLYARIEYAEFLPDWHPWEDYREGYSARRELGGGPVLTLSHTLDIAMWLFGMPHVVSCVAERQSSLQVDTEDTADILLQYQGGPMCSVHVDYVRRPPRRLVEVTGERGFLRWSDQDDALDWYSAEQGSWTRFPAPEGFTRNQMFLDEMAEFTSCVDRGGHPTVELGAGANVLRIALAALASAASGHAVPLRDWRERTQSSESFAVGSDVQGWAV
jgi:predicted dehydrogenase